MHRYEPYVYKKMGHNQDDAEIKTYKAVFNVTLKLSSRNGVVWF